MKITSKTMFGKLLALTAAFSLVFLSQVSSAATPAKPSDALLKALKAAGADSAASATADQFAAAVASLLVGQTLDQSAAIAAAAISVRPDLASNIVTLAINANTPTGQSPSTDTVTAIVSKTVSVNPDLAGTIAAAAATAAPNVSHASIVAASISSIPADQQASISGAVNTALNNLPAAPGEGPTGGGTTTGGSTTGTASNPANVSGGNQPASPNA